MTAGPGSSESSNESFYDEDSSTYDSQRWTSKSGIVTNNSQQSVLQELCASWINSSVLEVGSGTARFTIPLLRKQNRMTLADISDGMLSVARNNIEAEQLADQVDSYVKASIYDLPFEDSKFDHSMSINVINHLDSPELALRELARVTKTGSTIMFNFANLNSFYWPAARKINSDNKAVGLDVYSTWERPSEVSAMIESVGLEQVSQLGQTHIPRALEKYRLIWAVRTLDAISRRGPLRRFAPMQFCLCRKN
jgi:ubiquinone/menaquinone biosynthesis C-methylase UbiE